MMYLKVFFIFSNISFSFQKEATNNPKSKDNDGTSAKHNDRRDQFLSSNENKTPKAQPETENVAHPARRPPLLPTPNILTDLMNNTAIDQLLSTIRYGPNGSVLPASPAAAPMPVQNENTR